MSLEPRPCKGDHAIRTDPNTFDYHCAKCTLVMSQSVTRLGHKAVRKFMADFERDWYIKELES